MKYIILPLNSDVIKLLNKLEVNDNGILLDIESVLSFIFYAFSIKSHFNNVLDYSIVSFRNDFLLNRPEMNREEVTQTLFIFKELVYKIKINLDQYRITINEQLQFDFGSFLTESEIILKKSPDFINRI